jgi:DNA-binding CsgD family transcriptional regulator
VKLTRAEADVAALLVRGLTYVQIAQRRGSSRHTVGTQAARVFRKLGVGSRAQLLVRWMHGTVTVREPVLVMTALTSREREVAARVASGCSNKVVAFELGVSTGTVAVLLRRALRKLGLASRLDLIAAFNVIRPTGVVPL